MKEVLDALTAWGMQGYGVMLSFGLTWWSDAPCIGWSCSIRYQPGGSLVIGSGQPDPYGFHAIDPIAAARDALRQAGERWPEVVERMTQ